MGNDATEAALGLLGLTSATFNTVPTVPLKRKQSPPSSSRHQQTVSPSAGSDTISCICGFTYDDGFSIGCDICSRWCHAACFGIVETEVPEEWQCWVCSPRPVDKERAVRVQKARQRTALTHEAEKQRRRTSPGVDRKGRKTSGSSADGGGHAKRKRRASTVAAPSHEDELVDIDEPWTLSYVHINQDIVPHDETRDRLRRVASQWRGVTALKPNASEPTTPAILEPGDFQSSPLINLHPLPSSSFLSSISANLDPSVRPPSYAAHTARAIPSSGMITPYTSTITPSTVYLADPLNAYAHLSMPKPFVHLIGPPLDVALDSRATGNLGRFVRSGCRPNAVLRPVLCPRGKARATAPTSHLDDDDRETLTFGVFALRDLKAHEEVILGWEWDDGSVIHQLPALIDSPHIFPPHELQHLRQQLISMLHALSSTFTTCACGSRTRDCALARIAEFVDSQIPPTPSPSPPTPFATDSELWGSTSERSRLRTGSSEGFLKKRTNLGPLVGIERGFRTRERVPWSGGMGGVEMVPASPTSHDSKSPVDDSHPPVCATSELSQTAKQSKDRKGKAKATELDYVEWDANMVSAPDMDDDNPPVPAEASLPPKLRKRWIRHASESLRATHPDVSDEPHIGVIGHPGTEAHIQESDDKTDELMQVDEPPVDPAAAAMPPPPLPPRLAALSPRTPPSIALPSTFSTPGSSDTLSPSTRFANLSLLSPVIHGPSPYFAANAARRHSTSPTPPPAVSPPAQLPDHPSEQDATGKEPGNISPPVISRRSLSLPQVVTSVAEEVESHPPLQEPTPVESLSPPAAERPLSPSTSVTPEKRNMGLSSHSIAQDRLPAEEPVSSVPMDISTDQPERSDTPQLHDVTMSSATVPSISITEERTDPPPEPMAPLAEEPVQAKRSPSPPPRPSSPSKVKMSLKDFALRKKKQREQEASKVQERRSSVAPSDQGSSLPTTPVGQPATLVESPGIRTTSLVPASESLAPGISTAPSLGEAMASPPVTAPGNKPLMESGPSASGSAEERLDRARDAPAHETHGLKLEVMEPSVLPDAPMSNGYHSAPSTRPVEPSTHTTQPKTDAEPVVKARDVAKNERPRAPFNGTTRGFSPQEGNSRVPKSGTRSPRREHTHAGTGDASHEDGEIISPPPKSLPLPPRSNSPPTHPRSFYSPRGPASSTSRRPFRHQTLQNTLLPDRHLPNAPRALRDFSFSSPSSRPLGGPSLPRGPSADRDRVEWERERAWAPSSRGRGRGGNWNR
ncbi:hypothetical protein DAEQUDRAFT_692349 [Daedalea quercina L-15889]|uniref:PHD-type domain-containing protein n=1 Tax=Daedalea quercina L-15889 TaxID=1314783 RepID=A0A165PNV3_9APHY|nr:hypothetical protein DAEQUDRAFT_692349 [Daedalea quercina L-15889]